MKINKHLLAIALASASTAAFAVPFSPIDGRSFSMGGTGVANAKAASAGLFNPALLAAQKSTADFSLVLPSVGIIADDSENYLDTLQDIQDGSLSQMEAAIDTYNGSNANNVGIAAQALANDLPNLNNKPVTLDVGAGFGFGIPGKTLGVGLHVTGNINTNVITHIDPTDISLLNTIASDASDNTFANNCGSSYLDASCNPKDPADILQSDVDLLGVGIAEIGLSFAHEFAFGGLPVALGITPKFTRIDTIQYRQSVGSNEDIADILDDARYRLEYTDFNLDAGAAMTLGEPDTALVIGIVAKNLIEKSYKTGGSNGNAPIIDIELNTQLRAGIAKRWNNFSLASDIDITKNKGLGNNKASQFLAVGAEMDFRVIQLRAGYRHNLVSGGVQDMLTAGIGLGPVDISAMYADENSAGVNVQLGFSF